MPEDKISKTISVGAEPSDAEETKSWKDYAKQIEQNSPARYEDAAKFLLTIISLSLSIFLAIINRDLKSILDAWIVGGIVLWLLGIIAAFGTVVPEKYTYSSRQVESIKEMHQKIIRTKRSWLFSSFIFFLLGLICLFGRWTFL